LLARFDRGGVLAAVMFASLVRFFATRLACLLISSARRFDGFLLAARFPRVRLRPISFPGAFLYPGLG